MSTDYNYDEQGQFFPFFIATIAGLVTFPLTYNLLQPSDELESTAPRITTSFKPQHDDLIQGQKKKQRRRERKIKRFITVVVGYVVMAWMIYLIIYTQRTTTKIWNPYDILGISRSLSEKEIKSHFRKLSLKYHPDKVQITEGSNQTLEDVNAHYVELNKAYKALTDEEIRNNYLQYGHPDGKQSFSIGIALPTFLVADGYGKYTLAMYGALLGVLLPYIVGKWWYGTQRVTKEGVLVSSAGRLFQQWREDLARGGVITAVSNGDEFNQILKGNKAEAGLGKVEKAILADDASAAKLSAKDRLALQKMDGPKRKALALLWAYLGRLDLGDNALNDEKYEVAPQALALNESFIATCLSFGNLIPLLHAYGTAQNILAAVAPGASPLLQLPYITPSIATKLEGDSRAHLSLQTFMDLPEAERRKRALQPGGLSQAQYDEAVAVARQLPFLRLEKVFFKCMGEKHIVTGALTQLVLKCRFIPPGTTNVPAITDVDLEDLDPDEDDIDGLLGRKPPKKLRGKDGKTKQGSQPEKESAPPLAYAPYFSRDHAPRWHLFLSDMRQGRVAVPPTTFTTFPLPIFDAKGAPTFNVQTLKLQFQAPPQAGRYTFVMHLICDSYLGMDMKQEVTLDVEDQQKAAEIEEEEEISEPDEDSLAGQMNALKSGGLPASPRKKKAVAKQESDDESDTEGEDDDTSETDTDTSSDEE